MAKNMMNTGRKLYTKEKKNFTIQLDKIMVTSKRLKKYYQI